MTLVLEATVSHLARPVKEDGSGERISGFAFVQPRVDAAVQLDVVQPIEGQHTTFDTAEGAKGYRPSVLSGRVAELAQHQRSRPSPLTNGCRQPKNLLPLASDMLGIDRTPPQSSHIREIRRFTRHVPQFIGEITDTGRKPEA